MTHSILGPLPVKQAAVLDFIVQRIQDGKSFPSCIEISHYMGWKQHTSARDALMRLEWRGKLKSDIEVVTELRGSKRIVKRKVSWRLVDL